MISCSVGDRVTWEAHTLTDAPIGTAGTVMEAQRGGPYLTVRYVVRWDSGAEVGYGNGHVGYSLIKSQSPPSPLNAA